MDALAVIRKGRGPEILLVHGDTRPYSTWEALAPLQARWTLALVHRRGYPPSPRPVNGREDFAVDAADLASLLHGRPHLVAHSYGALGALLAAARRPARVRSLTLIEPPLYGLLLRDDPEVARLERVSDTGEGRPPGKACCALGPLREAGVPTLVASGGHAVGVERICDALAAALRGERLVAPGAGCFVAAAPGFAESLERFLASPREPKYRHPGPIDDEQHGFDGPDRVGGAAPKRQRTRRS
ncbi:MAG: alpha/beta hydrolase [Solirubrobacterales bacterium]